MIAAVASRETHPATCWSCLREFDAVQAPWCSHDPKLPSKMCPSCGRCFCQASEKYKQEFWRRAPAPLLEELELLSRSKDRLGDIQKIVIRTHESGRYSRSSPGSQISSPTIR